MIGAMIGREITGDIKQRPFKEAVASYESALSQFQAQARIHEAEASAEFNNARAAHQSRLKQRAREARQRVEGKDASLDRREAERILKAYLPMHNLDDETLLDWAGPLREILPTFLPQAKTR